MPRPKRTKPVSEKQRFEVLLEENRSQHKLILDGLTGLTERMERLEHRLERVERTVELLQSALIAHSNDIQGLRRDVRSLTERFEEHEKVVHAT